MQLQIHVLAVCSVTKPFALFLSFKDIEDATTQKAFAIR